MTLEEEILSYPKFFKNNGYCNLIRLSKPEFQSSTLFSEIYRATKFLINPLFSERIYCILNDINTNTICNHEKCNNIVKYLSYNKGYNKFCSTKCSANSKLTMEKRQETCLKKYNSNSYVNVEQRQQTNLERYGLLQFTNQPKTRQTKLERYNDANYNNRAKAKRTNLERYNNEHYNNQPKTRQTKLERYNDANYNNKEQHKETCLERYGFSSFSKTESYKEKIKETSINKYGRNNPTQKNLSNNTYSILQNKELFTEFVNNKSKSLISHELGVTFNTIVKYITKYNVEHLIVSGISKYEDIINNFLESKNLIVLRNSRLIIKPYELDFFLPEYNLAIEFNGVYWHNPNRYESKEDWFKYHQMKIDLCKAKGIQLLHLWENHNDHNNLIEKAINGVIDNNLNTILLEVKWE